MLSHRHAEAGTAPPAPLRAELEDPAVEGHRIVRRDAALRFVTQNLIEIDAADWHKRAGWIPRRPAERRVVLRDEVIARVLIGHRDRRHARHAKLIDQAILDVRFSRSLRPRACGE